MFLAFLISKRRKQFVIFYIQFFITSIYCQSACGPAQSSSILTVFLTGADLSSQPEFPVNVNSTVTILEIKSIDEKRGSAELKTKFNLWWRDHRLSYPGCSETTGFSLPVPFSDLEKLWKPDVAIFSAIESTILKVSKLHHCDRVGRYLAMFQIPETLSNLRIDPSTGHVNYQVFLIVHVSCDANYTKFPFDKLACYVSIGPQLPLSFIRLVPRDPDPILLLHKGTL